MGALLLTMGKLEPLKMSDDDQKGEAVMDWQDAEIGGIGRRLQAAFGLKWAM